MKFLSKFHWWLTRSWLLTGVECYIPGLGYFHTSFNQHDIRVTDMVLFYPDKEGNI